MTYSDSQSSRGPEYGEVCFTTVHYQKNMVGDSEAEANAEVDSYVLITN